MCEASHTKWILVEVGLCCNLAPWIPSWLSFCSNSCGSRIPYSCFRSFSTSSLTGAGEPDGAFLFPLGLSSILWNLTYFQKLCYPFCWRITNIRLNIAFFSNKFSFENGLKKAFRTKFFTIKFAIKLIYVLFFILYILTHNYLYGVHIILDFKLSGNGSETQAGSHFIRYDVTS